MLRGKGNRISSFCAILFLFLPTFFLITPTLIQSQQTNRWSDTSYFDSCKRYLSFKRHRVSRQEGRQFFKDVIKDVFLLHKNLFFSSDSFKVLASFFPLYIAGRMVDGKVHRCFYCRAHHKNVNQFPRWCHDAAQLGLAVPISLFGLFALFASDEELRVTSQVFMIGMPFVIFGKEVLKKIRTEANLRPWNEHFSCINRSFGGFPSGHMAEITYMTVLYGIRFGRAFAIPLGIFGTFLAVSFVTCNRHYVSQMIAGAGLGTMYALAANKLIDSKLSKNIDLTFSCDASGPKVSLSYTF